MKKSLMAVFFPLFAAVFSFAPAYGQSEVDEASDGYFDATPVSKSGDLPGTQESYCDGFFRTYYGNSICEFVIDIDHHNKRMTIFSEKAKDEKVAYEMAYSRMKQAKSANGGLNAAAQGDLDSFMTKVQVSKAIATMCKKAFDTCMTTKYCAKESSRCEIFKRGQAQFDDDAQQNLQSAFKSAETVKQSTGSPNQ